MTPGSEHSFSPTDRAGNQCMFRKQKTKITNSFFLVKNMSAGRQEAFDHFRRDNPLNHKLEEHKRILKQRYTEAKTLGEEINQSRNQISNKKSILFLLNKFYFIRSYERSI
jgi:kinesin family protein 6/9